MKPLWFIKYDPVRTVVSTMRFISKPFHRLKDAKEEITMISMEKNHAFVEYAVVRWTEDSDKIIIQSTIDDRPKLIY